jgi:hypothetical protein
LWIDGADALLVRGIAALYVRGSWINSTGGLCDCFFK